MHHFLGVSSFLSKLSTPGTLKGSAINSANIVSAKCAFPEVGECLSGGKGLKERKVRSWAINYGVSRRYSSHPHCLRQ